MASMHRRRRPEAQAWWPESGGGEPGHRLTPPDSCLTVYAFFHSAMFQGSLSNGRISGPVRFFALPLEYFRSTSGTDAKSFQELGMRCFGFSPLRLPPELDFVGMFHGIDERVPVSGLQFGVRALSRFLAAT